MPRELDNDLFERMLTVAQRSVRSIADEVETIELGWVVRTPTLPMVWSLNHLQLTGPVSFGDAVALADEYQKDLPYRHIQVGHDHGGDELDALFRAAGWRADREVYMALTDPPGDVAAEQLVELSEDQALVLTRLWFLEDHPGIGASSVEQLLEFTRREGRFWRERSFGLLDDGGSPLSMTKLRIDGTTAWVEHVYTVAHARGRGYARMLVTHVTALAVAGNPELTFIVADDNDWPKELYARIGFRPIDRTREFHLDLHATP